MCRKKHVPRSVQLMLAALALSAVVSTDGAVADMRTESAPLLREISGGAGRAAWLDNAIAETFIARPAQRDGAHIAPAGIWSGIKSAAKAVAGGVKKAGHAANRAVIKAGSKLTDKMRRAIELKERVTNAVKKAVIGAARKLAKKIKSKF